MKVKKKPHESQGGSTVGLTTATARLLFAPDEAAGGRADLVARRLGQAIRLGLLIDGERLPTETQLAAQMGVATVTLREALSTLREQGLVTTRRGRGGGTFVRAPADAREPLRHFGIHELQELGDQRAAISGAAAKLAAERALDEEVRRLEEQVDRLAEASDASERRRADTLLTIGIAAAAQSSRLTREEARLRAEIGDLSGLELSDDEHRAIVRDRRALVAAIKGRRGSRARNLAEQGASAETQRLISLRLRLDEGDDGGPSSESGPEPVLAGMVSDLGHIFADLDGLAQEFGDLLRAVPHRLAVDDLAALHPSIFAILSGRVGLVSGAGVVVAPGLLGDVDRWLEWWSATTPGSRPEPLRVNLEQTAPDFYDYLTNDWFTSPRDTLQPTMSGPFVDHACTNMYAITLSVPVVCDGAFVGVAAADVLVASLEREVMPALLRVGSPMALTTAEGRIIASNCPSVLSGERLDLSERSSTRYTSARAPLDGLRLVDLSS
ncbi:MAG: GntR family transcriptional regulator [Solirubrobacterales bacterium]